MSSQARGPSEAAQVPRGPDDAVPRDDVEGHSMSRKGPGEGIQSRRDTDGHSTRRDPGEAIVPRDEDDVEGHGMLLDPGIARDLARAREKEIQKRAERHGLEEEARRPLHPKR